MLTPLVLTPFVRDQGMAVDWETHRALSWGANAALWSCVICYD